MHVDGSKYLSRWFLFDKYRMPYTPRLHRFHSSDEEVPHDHPSDFFAIALWGWARELLYKRDENDDVVFDRERWVLPFVPRRTRAETIHRIVEPRVLITIVVFLAYRRQWGFWPLINGKRVWRSHMHFRREDGG